MPIHDWTRVTAGTFHAFHLAWLAEFQRALNSGLLPPGYYAMAEQVAGETTPDVLTLQAPGGEPPTEPVPGEFSGGNGGIAVAEAPPRVSVTATATEAMLLAARQRRLVIRHLTGDRVVALLEVVSPGNKERKPTLEAFIQKAIGALDQGYHLLIIDPFPPSRFDPEGLHGAIWSRIEGPGYQQPPHRPLTLASYASGSVINAYVEPVAVGAELPDMPLFLDPDHYVNVPLEPTYRAAWEGMPERWRKIIEGRN